MNRKQIIEKIFNKYGLSMVGREEREYSLEEFKDAIMAQQPQVSEGVLIDFMKWVIKEERINSTQPISEERIDYVFDANSSMDRKMSFEGFKAALKELTKPEK